MIGAGLDGVQRRWSLDLVSAHRELLLPIEPKQLLVVEHVALPLEQNIQASVAETAAFLGAIAFMRCRRPASSARVVWYLMVMRQQPIALHARRSLIPWVSIR